jgi:hypothetical protein
MLASLTVIILLDSAKTTIALLLPLLTPYTRKTPKHIFRINGLLDIQESFVVAAPESMLPVRLEGESLPSVSQVR